MSKTIAEMLEARKLPQQSVPICLRADVLAEIAELERKIEKIQSADEEDVRLGGDAEAADLADRIRALEAEAADFTVDLRLSAVPRQRWTKAKDAHTVVDPAGEKPDDVDLNGLMEDLFPESVVSPEMTEGQRTDFLNGLTEGQWESVITAMWSLNRGGVSVPKSLRASMVRGTRSETPKPGEQ